MRIGQLLRTAPLAALVVVGSASAAFAQGPFFVNSVADEVDADAGDGACLTASLVCTLRAAIMEANAFEGPDRDQIFLDMPGTYTLTIPGAEEDDALTGDLDINGDLDIIGSSPAEIIIDANGIDRVFHIRFGQVVFESMTIRGGVTSNTDPNGGGGILVDVDDPDVEGLIVADAVIRDNVANFEGGGIDLFNGNLSIFASTLTGNVASCGGGIHHFGEFLSLQNVTVSGNSVTCEGGGLLDEGSGDTIINHSTFAFNSPNNIVAAPVFTFVLSNSLLVQDTGQENCFIISVGGDIDGGGNFVGGNFSCDTIGITAGAELIEPLTLDPTSGHLVHRPLAGNPAINGGIDGACLALADPVTLLFNPVDQRGLPRPSDGIGCDSGAIEAAALAFTSGAVPGATWNTAYGGHTFTAAGEAALTYTVFSGALPTGLSLAASGALTGTPTAFSASPFVFTVRATDGLGQTVDQVTSITVGGTVASLTGDPTTGAFGFPYAFAFTSAGNGTLTHTTAGPLPTGLSLSPAGVLSGTPTSVGPFPFTVTLTDASGQTVGLPVLLTVTGTTTSITGTPPGATWNTSYPSFTFTGNGNGTLTYAVTMGALPVGLVLSSAGAITGTPTGVLGPSSFRVTVTDQTNQTANLNTSITVTGTAISISGTPTGATWNTAYTFAFSGTGNGALTFAITAGALPVGLSMSTAGVVSGSTTALGPSTFTVAVTDATAQTTSLATGITVVGTAVSITGAPPQATVNAAYNFAFGGTGSGTLTFTLAGGRLPAGLQLGSNGSIFGTPTESGDFPITIEARDSSGQIASGSYTVRINAPPVITGLGDATVEANREQDITITIADDFTNIDQVTVTVSASEGTILSGVTLSGSGATRTLRITPAEDRTGQATITMMAHDGLVSSTRAAIITVSNPGVPNPPANLTAALDGDAVLFTWQPPASGPVPTFFVLEGGNGTRLVTVPVVNTGHATSHRLVIPGGTWFFRARSGNLAGTSGASNEITGTVGSGVPGPPLGLVAQVAGNQVQVAWHPPTVGGPVNAWRIEVGTSPGASNLGVFALPGGQLAVGGSLPDGVYFARLRGVNAFGDGPPSNEVRFTVGGGSCSESPDPPVLLPASIANRLVTLTWRPPLNATVSNYQIVVSDLVEFSLGAVTSFAAQAPPGAYHVRLLAINDCGTSLPSNAILVTVP